jgi:hypothetical protein
LEELQHALLPPFTAEEVGGVESLGAGRLHGLGVFRSHRAT